MRPLGLVLTILLVGCSEAPPTSTCVPGVGECESPPGADEVIAGVNLTALFADATADEIRAVGRTFVPMPLATFVQAEPTLDAPDGARWYPFSLRDAAPGGNPVFSHGVVRVPGGAGSTRLPVVVILTDGEDGAGTDDLLTQGPYESLAEETVQVVMSYRGEPFRLGDATLASEVEASPYRGDVEDLLAVLEFVGTFPRADDDRVALVGFGRGGTVALVAALTDPSIDVVVTLGAPTDLLGASFRADVRTLLQGRTVATPYPALEALAEPVLDLRDGLLDTEESRRRLLSLSPGYFGADLPAVLALHAVGDAVVGDDQLTRLGATMTSEPGVSRLVERVEGVTHETLPTVPAVRRDLTAFLLDAL